MKPYPRSPCSLTQLTSSPMAYLLSLDITSAITLLFLLSQTTAAADATPPSQQPTQLADGAGALPPEELAAIFRALGELLGEPSWPQLHPRPCTDTPWPGLQCELGRDGRLHAARLHLGPDVASPPCRPGATLPSSLLAGLPYLRSLSLFGCFVDQEPQRPGEAAAVVSLPPAMFANGTALEQLVLSSNPGLGGVIPASLSYLRRLRVLSLSQNGFHGSIPKELGRLTTLQQLDLSYNNISGEVPEELGGLASLSILDLSYNNLAGGIPANLGTLRLLQKADLSHNRLAGRVPPELGQLRNLVLLDLGRNALTGPLPASLAGLGGSLQYLLLQDNPIGTALPAALVGSLRRLQVLGLSGCNLTGRIPEPAFAALRNLTALSLDRNRLDGPIPAGLGALPHLGQLNLSQNRLAGEIGLPSEFVARLGKRLDVRDNGELCIGRERYGDLSGYLAAPPCAAGSGGAGEGSPAADGENSAAGRGSAVRAAWIFCFASVFAA